MTSDFIFMQAGFLNHGFFNTVDSQFSTFLNSITPSQSSSIIITSNVFVNGEITIIAVIHHSFYHRVINYCKLS